MPTTLKAVTISNTGGYSVSTPIGSSNGLAVFAGGNTSTTLGQFIADKVWNAVWNDIADFQLLNDELIYGKCYVDHADGARIPTERCQLGVIGIASDTFGQALGVSRYEKMVPIAVAGWALAYVDKEYLCGTPLTNDEYGFLTEMTMEEKRNFPERIVAIYKKPEVEKAFGTSNNKVIVNNRHWVKVK